MKTILSLTLLLAVMGAKAQNNLVVFSENGEKFFLVINGVKQNLEAETNVKVIDLIQPNYKTKIIFEDKAKGVVDQNIYFMQGGEPVKNYEFVYSVGMKKKGLYKARPVSAVAIGPQAKTQSDQTVVHYATSEPTQSNNNVISDGSSSGNINVADDRTSVSDNGDLQVQQTQTQSNNGGNVNVGMNMNGLGVNMNVNVSDNSGGTNNGNMTTTSSQTVTNSTTKSANGATTVNKSTTVSGSNNSATKTSSSSNSTLKSQTVAMDGYETGTKVDNSRGCASGMSAADFNSAKESINAKSFEDSKLTMAKQVLDNNCMTSAQVKETMSLFNFENSKLDLAKYAYGRTVDKNNYYKINDAFTFESSIKELDDHIKKSTK
jgi:hypothetical protein